AQSGGRGRALAYPPPPDRGPDADAGIGVRTVDCGASWGASAPQPTEQACPLRVKAVGLPFVPLWFRLKPTASEPLAAIVEFQERLVAVTFAPDCCQSACQPGIWMVCPFGKANCSVQPLMGVLPLFAIVISTVAPVSQDRKSVV